MSEPKSKPVQYVKVLNTKHGHNGYKYKLGENIDPHSMLADKKTGIKLKDVDTCSPGAFYFVKPEELHHWVDSGDSIAWITPLSEVKPDPGPNFPNKFKAQKVNVTKILSFKQAEKWIKRNIKPTHWVDFGISPTIPEIQKNADLNGEEKLRQIARQVKKADLPKYAYQLLKGIDLVDWLYDNNYRSLAKKQLAKLHPAQQIRYHDECGDNTLVLPTIIKHRKDPEVIRAAKNLRYYWDKNDVKLILKYKLFGLLDKNAISNLRYDGEWKLLAQIILADKDNAATYLRWAY